MFSTRAETRAQKLVAIQFFLLAPYVAIESVRALLGDERPEHSWVGIGLAISSVILMPALGIAKQRLADQLGSAATKGEGRQNMLCAYLAGALLLGLLGNVLWGAWWLDPIVGLLIAALAVKEGREAWKGEGCCVSDPLAACALDSGGLRSQSDRYRALGDHVAASEREPQALTVRFDDDVDLDLLLETVEVERGCCTFFDLAPDVQRRELVVSVGRSRARAGARRDRHRDGRQLSRQGLAGADDRRAGVLVDAVRLGGSRRRRSRRRRARRGSRRAVSAPAMQPVHCCHVGAGGLVHARVGDTSETAKRPPGRSTRAASREHGAACRRRG